MPKLTTKLVLSTLPSDKDVIIWDSEIKGFHCKITPTGKRVYLYYYRTSDFRERRPAIGTQGIINCDQARDIAKEWQAVISKGGDPSQDKSNRREMVTVKELSERYMREHAHPKKKPSSASKDQRLWNLHILPLLGSCKVSSVTKDDISKLHSTMQHIPVTANHCRSLISKALNLAEVWGYRKDNTNPCRHIKKYKENMRKRYLSKEELNKLNEVLLLAEANKIIMSSAANAIKLLVLTGCRLSEILTLKWEYVDIDSKLLRLPDSKTGAKFVYLPPDAIAILEKLYTDPERPLSNPYVIIGREENSYLANLHKPWGRIKKLADIEDVRLHDLRHTFASIAVASGFSLPIIGALLGHTQPSTTARYAHLQNDLLKDAAGTVGNAIQKAMSESKDKS